MPGGLLSRGLVSGGRVLGAGVGVLVVFGLALAGCQQAGPVVSSTPTVVVRTPTATPSASATPVTTPSPSVAATLSQEAESKIRNYFTLREVVLRTGTRSPVFDVLLTGKAIEEVQDLVDDVNNSGTRFVGGSAEPVWIRPTAAGAVDGDLFLAEACMDTSGGDIFRNGRLDGKGMPSIERFHLQRKEGQLRVSLIEGKDVESC